MKHSKITKQSRQGEALHVPPGGGAGQTPYPNFQITNAEKWNLDWDEKTRQLVIDRVENVPPYRFFSIEEAKLLEALCNCVLPQHDRPEGQQVPIAPWIDEGLHTGEGLGYRYEGMPEDRQAYRMGLQGFDQTAGHLFGAAFIDLDPEDQNEVIRQVAEGS
ncbi:MAG TPA: gluconate 2-dehydrogenase subunit 3 family protein, partial [Anaerolineales bacterium]